MKGNTPRNPAAAAVFAAFAVFAAPRRGSFTAPRRGSFAALAALAASGLALGLAPAPLFSQELPVPAPRNSVVVSVEHSPADGPEVDYIKANFNFGLYAWLSFSVTALVPILDWHAPLSEADAGIQALKDQVNGYIQAAKAKDVRFHLVLVSGLPRGPEAYREAKEEDVRNCQWYNDNKLAADDQISQPDSMNHFVFGTLSRYARKIRANLEAKGRAAFAYLGKAMADDSETFVAVSAWGETELNYNRIIQTQSQQEHFCDYSPFAVLEFRDWIGHTGEYDDANGRYKGQGWVLGGARYQGTDGLGRFNAEFGTNFATWDLRYFHWSLADDFDTNPQDAANNDPRRIPWSAYAHGGMMPASGPNYIAGGFDPPRTMARGNKFWELWTLFRETMVANSVREAAVWASEAGIAPDRFFSHQIPGDHLFNTNPASVNKNPRYYTGASPLWTANVAPYGSPGATVYDVKFDTWFARTTDAAIPALAAMSPVWAIMEYDPELYPPGLNIPEGSPEFILAQFMRPYDYGAFLVNFWRWWDDTKEHRIKGMNKEIALRNFIQRIRDKAKSRDLAVVYTPPQVAGLRAEFAAGQAAAVELRLSGKIWDGRKWEWREWGDFLHFEVYRGAEPNFAADAAHLVGTTREYLFRDAAVSAGQVYYYKVRAVNAGNAAGPLSREVKVPGYGLLVGAGAGGTTDPAPGAQMYEPGATATVRAIPNDKFEFSHWSGDASGTANPIQVVMNARKDIQANFVRAGMFPPLNFTGKKVVNRSLSQEQAILVLNWQADPRNKNVAKHRVYLVEGNTRRLLAELDPAATEYSRRGIAKDKAYTFGITTVNAEGLESLMVTVTVQ